MKFLLSFLILLCFVGSAFGQQNNTNNQNIKPANSNSNGTQEQESLEEIQLTSPVLKEATTKENRVKSESANKKSKTQAPSAVKQESAQTLDSKFSVTKKTASTQMTSRSPSVAQQNEMDKVIDQYKATAPESFEYHYFTYAAGNYDVSLIAHLRKAQALKPKNSDVLVQLAAYNTIVGDSIEATKQLKQLVEMDKLTSEVLSYDADVLNSVPQGGYLLTHGFDDGFGTLYMKSVKKVRKDVKIISLDFMQSKFYRDSLRKAGFKMPASTTIDVSFLNEFCKKNADKKLFLSMTFPKPYFAAMADQLYVHGLVFGYGKNGAAILEENEVLWNKLLKSEFIYKAQTEKGKQLTSNYLPMLFYLRSYYEMKGLKAKVAEIDKAIDRIGMQSSKFSKVNSMRGRN